MRFRAFCLTSLAVLGPIVPLCHALPGDDAYQAGVALYRQGQYDKSIVQLQLAFQADPDNWQALQIIAYDFYAENNFQESVRACDMSLRIHPDNPALRQFADKMRPLVPNPADQTASRSTAENFVPKNSLYLDIGLSSPEGSDGSPSQWNSGPNWGVGYGFGMSRFFSVILDADYSIFSVNSNYYNANVGYPTSAGALHITTVLANAKIKFLVEDNPVVPYIILGLGVQNISQDPYSYNISGSRTINEPATSSSGLALRCSLGADIKLSKGTYLYTEGKGVATSNDNYSSSVFGTLQVGMKLDM